MLKKQYEIEYEKLIGFRSSITQLIEIIAKIEMAKLGNTTRDFQWYIDNDLGWTYTTCNMDILKYPKYAEKVTCTTVPVSYKDGILVQSFKIEDEEGDVAVKACLQATLLDAEMKSQVEPEEGLIKEFGVFQKAYTDSDFEIENATQENGYSLIGSNSIKVRRLDTDMNSHTNSIKYIEWAENEVPEEFLGKEISNMKIKYIRESFIYDSLDIEAYANTEDKVVVKIKKYGILVCEICFTYNLE